MANGHVEILEPLSDQTQLTDSKSTSDTKDMENTVEMKLLMAYAKRRRPAKDREALEKGTLVAQMGDPHSTPQTLTETEKGKDEKVKIRKKKRGVKKLTRLLNCIRPQQKEAEQPQPAANGAGHVMFRCGIVPDGELKTGSIHTSSQRRS